MKQSQSKTSNYEWTWLEPNNEDSIPLTIIGHRIRCILPKFSDKDQSASLSSTQKTSYSRILEGEVITARKEEKKTNCNKKIGKEYESSLPNECAFHLTVELLVENDPIQLLPPSIRIQLEESVSKPDKKKAKAEIGRKRRELETKIRGENKTTIKINLPMPIQCTKRANTSNKEFTDSEFSLGGVTVKHWVIYKRVDASYFGTIEGASEGLIGNSNDESIQKENNFNWAVKYLSEHQYRSSLFNRSNETVIKELPLRFGEVVDIIPSSQLEMDIAGKKGSEHKVPGGGKSTQTSRTSLATVLIRPLAHLEDCKSGRMSHHFGNELVDIDMDSPGNGTHTCGHTLNAGVNTTRPLQNSLVELPIEDLIVVGKSANRMYDEQEPVSDNSDNIIIRYTYSIQQCHFKHLCHNNEISESSRLSTLKSIRVCHRCQVIGNEEEMGQCESEHCELTTQSSSSAGSEGNRKWWCRHCIKVLRKRCKFANRRNDKEWIGPCCSDACDCYECAEGNSYPFRSAFFDNCKRLCEGDASEKAKRVVDVQRGDRPTCMQCFRQGSKLSFVCSICHRILHQDCLIWRDRLKGMDRGQPDKRRMSDGQLNYKCRGCENSGISPIDTNKKRTTLLQATVDILQIIPPTDFSLPLSFLNDPLLPKSLKSEPKRRQVAKRRKKDVLIRSTGNKIPVERNPKNASKVTRQLDKMRNSREKVEPSCSRIVPYDASKHSARSTNNSAAHAARSLASSRSGGRNVGSRGNRRIQKGNDTHSKSSSRAARASQRRILKDAASFGVVKDNLSGCEHALRFGKSVIHGWGVFTGVQINAGDLIVEYRGVLIGIAVADKRELEYERAKIGSDYMFRIDSDQVSDATHHGNLARFINASCTPNCHTQIITLNSVKRIAIYAKRDISPGEELCYDYKFESEFDESKRIPCNCGTVDCRGFMNWNKKYVAIEGAKVPSRMEL